MGIGGVQHLADALRNNKVNIVFSLSYITLSFIQTLATITLWENGIGDERTEYLVDALRNNTVSFFLLFIPFIYIVTFHTDTDPARYYEP